jgi:hypothetical protein
MARERERESNKAGRCNGKERKQPKKKDANINGN